MPARFLFLIIVFLGTLYLTTQQAASQEAAVCVTVAQDVKLAEGSSVKHKFKYVMFLFERPDGRGTVTFLIADSIPNAVDISFYDEKGCAMPIPMANGALWIRAPMTPKLLAAIRASKIISANTENPIKPIGLSI